MSLPRIMDSHVARDACQWANVKPHYFLYEGKWWAHLGGRGMYRAAFKPSA